MLIQVHQHHIAHSESLDAHARACVEGLEQRYMGRITRVDIYVEDLNGAHKGGDDDQRCLMEAHVAGMSTVTAEARGEDPFITVSVAAAKLGRVIESRCERANARTRMHAPRP